MVKGNHLLDATTVASLSILLTNAGVAQMPKMPGLKFRVMATQAEAIKTMVMAIVVSHGLAHG